MRNARIGQSRSWIESWIAETETENAIETETETVIETETDLVKMNGLRRNCDYRKVSTRISEGKIHQQFKGVKF